MFLLGIVKVLKLNVSVVFLIIMQILDIRISYCTLLICFLISRKKIGIESSCESSPNEMIHMIFYVLVSWQTILIICCLHFYQRSKCQEFSVMFMPLEDYNQIIEPMDLYWTIHYSTHI